MKCTILGMVNKGMSSDVPDPCCFLLLLMTSSDLKWQANCYQGTLTSSKLETIWLEFYRHLFLIFNERTQYDNS